MDVFEQESDNSGNPLFTLDNIVFALHTGVQTVTSSDRMDLYAAIGIYFVLSGTKSEWNLTIT